MKHVFTRSGGKSRIGSKIIEKFPENYADYTYVSPFLGAGWIWLLKNKSEFSLLNDLDSVLFNAWMCVKKHPEELVRLFDSEIKHERIAYQYLEDLYLKPIEFPDIDKAMKFIMISKLLRGSVLDPKRRVQRFAIMKMSIKTIQEQIIYLSGILSNTWIYCMDATKFIDKVLSLKAKRNRDLLFYLDIPYHKTANNYLELSTGNKLTFDLKSTEAACSKIDNQGHLFFLTVNSTDETERIASEYNKYVLRNVRKGCIGDELLITNYS